MATGQKFFGNMSSGFASDRLWSKKPSGFFEGSALRVGAAPTKTVTDTYSFASSGNEWTDYAEIIQNPFMDEIIALANKVIAETLEEIELHAALLGYTHHGVIETPSRRFAVGE